MSIFVKALPASEPRSTTVKVVAIIYAAVLVVMAVSQLFTFEEFTAHMQQLKLPLGEFGSYALAPLIVVAEVFAIPFLLRMTLSPAFRYVSMFLGIVAASLWLFISLSLTLVASTVENVGLLGTLVNLAPGWLTVLLSLALFVFAVYSAWGLWPNKKVRS